MTYYKLFTKDIFTNNTEKVDLIISTISKEIMEELILKFQEEKWGRDNAKDLDILDFIDYLQEKGIDAKILEAEDLMFNEYDSS